MRKLVVASLVSLGLLAGCASGDNQVLPTRIPTDQINYYRKLEEDLTPESYLVLTPEPMIPGKYISPKLPWPVIGPVSSYMDASHPLGIDIETWQYEEFYKER